MTSLFACVVCRELTLIRMVIMEAKMITAVQCVLNIQIKIPRNKKTQTLFIHTYIYILVRLSLRVQCTATI